jgi:predicted CoA-binding protein
MEPFLSKSNLFAVVGATNNPDKWGYKVYKKLLSLGFNVVPVNPKYADIEGKPCYKTLADINPKPDVVVTVVPPEVTKKVLNKCHQLGIANVWMQPGSESDEVIEQAKQLNLNFISNACIIVDGLKESWQNI